MYTLGDFVEMKKPHACVIKGRKQKHNMDMGREKS